MNSRKTRKKIGFMLGGLSLAVVFTFQHKASANDPVADQKVHIQFEKVYLDGDVGIENREETIGKAEDVKAAYKGWRLVDQKRALSCFASKSMTSPRSAKRTVTSA